MRAYLTTFLLVLTLPIGELHMLWEGDTRAENWILTVDRTMLIKWNMKYVEAQVIVILYFAAWWLWKPNKVNWTTVIAFFWLAIIDTCMYFYDYKTGDFGKVYYWFVGIWFLVYKWHSITAWIKQKKS